jgi:hypothetical protein
MARAVRAVRAAGTGKHKAHKEQNIKHKKAHHRKAAK